MDQIKLYIALFVIIAACGILFRHSTLPGSLLLVIVGMLLSFLPAFPPIVIDPHIVFNIFLPLLLYEASAYSSTWREIKLNWRPIALLSIGHVIFITFLVAGVIHYLIPEFNWPLAILLGAVISPPDDVAILAIAENMHMPHRVMAILKGEAMLNDATALIIYRFALIALITSSFSLFQSVLDFFIIIICETVYGVVLANFIGQIRLRVHDANLQMLISVLTPFLAYVPATSFHGSGVIATVITGLFIGNYYWERYPPDIRLSARSVWETLGYCVQSILFLLVGLNFKFILEKNSDLSYHQLFLYSGSVIATVIIGRFLWCYPASYLPRLIPSIRKAEGKMPWQYPFIVSWSGMRGGISLAAALAVPTLATIHGIHPKALLLFLVFSVIIATLLIQGLSLPWIVKKTGIIFYGEREQLCERYNELLVRLAMTAAVLKWLAEYQVEVTQGLLASEIKLRIKEYSLIEKHFQDRISHYNKTKTIGEWVDLKEKVNLLMQMLYIERDELRKFWRDNKISLEIRYKLEKQIDLKMKHLTDLT